MENQNNIIYVYKYLWQIKGEEDRTFVKVLSAPVSEHTAMRDALLNDEKVVKASCVYLSEYNVEKLEKYETIKKEVKKDEKENG